MRCLNPHAPVTNEYQRDVEEWAFAISFFPPSLRTKRRWPVASYPLVTRNSTHCSLDRSQVTIAHFSHTGHLYLTTALLWSDHLCSFPLLYRSSDFCEMSYSLALGAVGVHFPSMALFTRADLRCSSRVITPLFVADHWPMVWIKAWK